MKIFFVSAAFSLLTVCNTHAQEYSEQKEITTTVIQYFESNQIEDIYDLFDDTMKVAVTIEELENIWNSLPTKCGAYLGSGDAVASKVQGMVVVNQFLDFEITDLDIRLAFNFENKISGLIFVPPVKKRTANPEFELN